jgi:hypothetical protein
MKAVFAAVGLFLAFGVTPADAISLDALEKGASAWCVPVGTNWTGSEAEMGPMFADYLRGFLQGINISPLLETGEPATSIFFPDDWMYDPRKAGPSFLAFVAKHKPKDFKKGSEGRDSAILLAWYLGNHSASDRRGEIMRDVMLKEYFTPGLIEKETTERDQNNARIQALNKQRMDEYRARLNDHLKK